MPLQHAPNRSPHLRIAPNRILNQPLLKPRLDRLQLRLGLQERRHIEGEQPRRLAVRRLGQAVQPVQLQLQGLLARSALLHDGRQLRQRDEDGDGQLAREDERLEGQVGRVDGPGLQERVEEFCQDCGAGGACDGVGFEDEDRDECEVSPLVDVYRTSVIPRAVSNETRQMTHVAPVLEVSQRGHDDHEQAAERIVRREGLQPGQDVVADRHAVLPLQHVGPEPVVREPLGRVDERVARLLQMDVVRLCGGARGGRGDLVRVVEHGSVVMLDWRS